MSEYERIIKPEAKYLLAEVIDNPKWYNSYLEVMDGSIVVDILPTTPRNLEGAKPPAEYYQLEEIRTLEGTIAIDKTTPEFSLAPDLNPFHQLIYSIVADIGHTKPNNIRKSLINNYRVLPDTYIAHKIIDKIIKTMKKHAYLMSGKIDGIEYYVKGRSLETDAVHLIDYRKGYDPNVDQLLNYVESYGERNRDQIDKHMMQSIGWITDMEVIDMYLDALEEGELWGERICANNKGNITKIRENWYKYQQPMQPWGEKTLD